MIGRLVGGLALVAITASSVAAEELRVVPDDGWCSDRDGDGGQARHCEVREATLKAGALDIDAAPNGGIDVRAWDRPEVRLQAKVHAAASDEGEARRLAEAVQIVTSPAVRATGPRRGEHGHGSWWPGGRERHAWWSVSYRLWVPRQTDLDLRSLNGGIAIEGVQGRVRFETTNGGVRLVDAGGDVHGRTTNGGVKVTLSGTRWEGTGLDVQTTNGGVVLALPRGYNAHLRTGTVNGSVDLQIPLTVQGRLNRSVEADLGSGGPPIRVTTTNGSVVVRSVGGATGPR